MKKLRIYPDTSVIGGCLDEEFTIESRAFLRMAVRNEIDLIVSDLLVEELIDAPEGVRRIFTDLPEECMIQVTRTPETERLRECYLEAKVIGSGHENDAHHVAIATVYAADVIVSWNFQHIVSLGRIKGYNSVNLREGYSPIEIRSPREVIE